MWNEHMKLHSHAVLASLAYQPTSVFKMEIMSHHSKCSKEKDYTQVTCQAHWNCQYEKWCQSFCVLAEHL